MPGNIFSLYNLPPLKRAPLNSKASELLASSKVLSYSKKMPVNFSQITDPDYYLKKLRTQISENKDSNKIIYHYYISGLKKASELNQFLETLEFPAQVTLTSDVLQIDEPIILKDNLSLKGNNTQCLASNVNIAFLGEGISNVELNDLVIKGAKINAVLLLNCMHSKLNNLKIINSLDYGIILKQQCSYIQIEHCQFINNFRSGIMLHEGTHHSRINQCEVTGTQHSSNWAAGIVITALESISTYQTQDSFEENYFYPKDLKINIAAVPYRNLVENCYVHHNQSSGIYVDGGNGNVIFSNVIEHNDKEGLCLDFFAATNIVLSNTITSNGFRKYQSDHALEVDCIKECGRLHDGSSIAKLPNISLDNTGLNIILKNNISNAGGDGIKMVRSSFRNIIGLNIITDNAQGSNFMFCFSGILLGSAGCEVENDTSGLDRLPSIENILFGNMIFGQHVTGIVYDAGCTHNDTFDNFVAKQKGATFIKNATPNIMLGNSFSYPTPFANFYFSQKNQLSYYINQCFNFFKL